MAGRFSIPREQVLDENGDPLSGAKLAFFESGTSTPQDTYSDDALTVANTNPVIADSAGRFGDIFLLGADYKVTLSKSDDTVVWTADPVRSPTPKSTVVTPVSTATQLTAANDGNLISADATAGGFIITLPTAADAGDGYEVTIQKIDSSTNVVTIDGSGSETINGLSDIDLPDQYASATLRCDGTTWYAYAISPTTETRILPPEHIDGLDLSNNVSLPARDVDIAPGSARSDDDTGNIILSTALTKKLDAAFAEGNNQGGLDTGSIAADTAYFIWIIGKPDGTSDGLFSLSSTLPALPSGFTFKRLRGRIRTDASSNIAANAFTTFPKEDRYRAEVIVDEALPAATNDEVLAIDISDYRDVYVTIKDLSATAVHTTYVQFGDATDYTTNVDYDGAIIDDNGTALWSSVSGVLITNIAAAATEHWGGIHMIRIPDAIAENMYGAGYRAWQISGIVGASASGDLSRTGGILATDKTIDRVRISTSAGNFDAGRWSVSAQ